MFNEEIIAMAREAEISLETMVLLCGVEIQVTASPLSVDELARFAALVAAKEREACAKVCEGFQQGNSATYIDDDWADMCAEAIRARGTKEGA